MSIFRITGASENQESDIFSFERRTTIAAAKNLRDTTERFLRRVVRDQIKVLPSAMRKSSSLLDCLKSVGQTLRSVIAVPSWTHIHHINTSLQDILSHCVDDILDKRKQAETQLKILQLLKAIIEVLASKGLIHELNENYDSLSTLNSNISVLILAYYNNANDSLQRNKIKEGFEDIFNIVESHNKCYSLFKSGKVHSKFAELVKAPNELCGFCLEKNLTQRTDFTILSNCVHRFCLSCAKSWFKKK